MNSRNVKTIFLSKQGKVKPIHYLWNGTEKLDGIKRVDFAKKSDLEFVIRIEQSERIEYWYFCLENIQINGAMLSASISSKAIYNAYNDAWEDEKASGLFNFDSITRFSKLELDIHFGGRKENIIFEWEFQAINEIDEGMKIKIMMGDMYIVYFFHLLEKFTLNI